MAVRNARGDPSDYKLTLGSFIPPSWRRSSEDAVFHLRDFASACVHQNGIGTVAYPFVSHWRHFEGRILSSVGFVSAFKAKHFIVAPRTAPATNYGVLGPSQKSQERRALGLSYSGTMWKLAGYSVRQSVAKLGNYPVRDLPHGRQSQENETGPRRAKGDRRGESRAAG